MDLLKLIAEDTLVPVVFASVVAVIAAVLTRRSKAGAASAAMAVAVAGAFALGLGRLATWPELPLGQGQDAWTWLAWIALGTAVATALGHLAVRPRGLRALGVLLLATGAGWLLVEPYVPHALSLG